MDRGMESTAAVQLVEAAREGLKESHQAPWLARVDAAYGAIRSAFERSSSDGETDAALTIATGLEEYWPLRSKLAVGCEWLTRALQMEGGTTGRRADALRALAQLEFARGHYKDSLHAYEAGLELYTDLDDAEHVVDSLCEIGFIAFIYGRFEWAIAVSEDARRRSRAAGFPAGAARALRNLALIAHARDEYEQAMILYEQEVEILRGTADRDALASALDVQGMTAARAGDVERAVACLEESVELFESIGRVSSQALASIFLGDAERKRGDRRRARACFERSVELARGVGDAGGEGLALLHLGRLRRDGGENDEVLGLIERSCALLREAQDTLWLAMALLDLGRLHRAEERVPAARECFEESLRLHRELGDMTTTREVEYELTLCAAPLVSERGA